MTWRRQQWRRRRNSNGAWQRRLKANQSSIVNGSSGSSWRYQCGVSKLAATQRGGGVALGRRGMAAAAQRRKRHPAIKYGVTIIGEAGGISVNISVTLIIYNNGGAAKQWRMA